MHQKLIEKGRKSLKEKLYVYRNIEGVFHFRRLVLQSIIDNLRTMISDAYASEVRRSPRVVFAADKYRLSENHPTDGSFRQNTAVIR